MHGLTISIYQFVFHIRDKGITTKYTRYDSEYVEINQVFVFCHVLSYDLLWSLIWDKHNNPYITQKWSVYVGKPDNHKIYDGPYIYICVCVYIDNYRRKFRSQTSDNMDKWKAAMGRVREEKRREEKKKQDQEEKVSEERRSRCAKR